MKVYHKFMPQNDYENYLIEPLKMESAQRPRRPHYGNTNNNNNIKSIHKVLREKAYHNDEDDIGNNNHQDTPIHFLNGSNWTTLHSHTLEDLNKASGDYVTKKKESKNVKEGTDIEVNKRAQVNETGNKDKHFLNSPSPAEKMVHQFIQQQQQKQQYQYQQHILQQQQRLYQNQQSRKQRTYSDSDVINYNVTSFNGKYSPSANNISAMDQNRLKGGHDVPLKPLDTNLLHPGDNGFHFMIPKNAKGK